jgi:hypothetical protein
MLQKLLRFLPSLLPHLPLSLCISVSHLLHVYPNVEHLVINTHTRTHAHAHAHTRLPRRLSPARISPPPHPSRPRALPHSHPWLPLTRPVSKSLLKILRSRCPDVSVERHSPPHPTKRVILFVSVTWNAPFPHLHVVLGLVEPHHHLPDAAQIAGECARARGRGQRKIGEEGEEEGEEEVEVKRKWKKEKGGCGGA